MTRMIQDESGQLKRVHVQHGYTCNFVILMTSQQQLLTYDLRLMFVNREETAHDAQAARQARSDHAHRQARQMQGRLQRTTLIHSILTFCCTYPVSRSSAEKW